MPAIGVTGAVFTVSIGGTQYEDQVTSGTINTTPTILRTKTLSGGRVRSNRPQLDHESRLSIR